jgi:hypothetical protein
MGGSFYLATKRRKPKPETEQNMETIAFMAVMAILAACTAAGMVGNDEITEG